MELGPVPGIRAFPAAKAPTADFQLSAVLDIEAIARAGNSARAGARKKGAGAEEMEDDLAFGSDAADSADDLRQSRISLFA
jgi:hypothetical protein